MSKLNKIEDAADGVLEDLIDSVDVVLFDIDGVLVRNKTVIPGATEFIEKLKKLQKKVLFVTNNTAYSKEGLQNNLRPFKATEDKILNPNDVLINYLDEAQFKKDIYAITTSVPRQFLRDAGYNLITYEQIQPTPVEETVSGMKDLIARGLEACKNVGAVLLDFEPNLVAGDIQIAKSILNHHKQKNDIMLLSGMNDDQFPTGDKFNGLGAKYYIESMERWTKRTSEPMGKPGRAMADFVRLRFGIKDNSNVLMIGDNVSTDITFGVTAGFKTLLVLSGCTTKEEVMPNWSFPEDVKPDYVAPSLAEVYEKIRGM